jgi:hypothetical protein
VSLRSCVSLPLQTDLVVKDLISYRITQVSPVLKVEEAAIGSGDKCGASYVDKVSHLLH